MTSKKKRIIRSPEFKVETLKAAKKVGVAAAARQIAKSNETSQHFFASTTETGLGHLVIVDPNSVDASEFDAVNFISTDFNNTNDYGTYLWGRILAEYEPTAELAQRTTSHNKAGHWSRTL
ncbi:hypothetical protein SAMN04488244_1531, partial [Vibrio hangzhouensis]